MRCENRFASIHLELVCRTLEQTEAQKSRICKNAP